MCVETMPASLFRVGFARLRSISLFLENTRVLPLVSKGLPSSSSIVNELENIPSGDSIEPATESSFDCWIYINLMARH